MRRVLILAGYLIGMAVVGFLFFLIPRFNGHRGSKATATPFAVTATAIPSVVAATATSTPLPASTFPAAHIVIPSLKLDAPWVPIGYLSDGLTMDSPAGPKDVGWYNFSGQPGGPSNAIFRATWTGTPANQRSSPM